VDPDRATAPGATWHIATAAEAPADARAAADRIRAMVTIGQVDRATALLDRYGPEMESVARLELAGAIAAAEGRWNVAAHAYVAAATMTDGVRRGELDAHAALAFERAELLDSARAAWVRARERLPALAGWLALRVARLTRDSAAAESLLVNVPPEAATLALETRAHLRLLVGNPQAAEAFLDAAGRDGHAAELALARGDSGTALRYAALAIRSSDTGEVRRATVLLQEHIPPPTASLALAAARAVARIGGTRQAVIWGLRAVELGDSAPQTYLQVGEWLTASGQRRDALAYYARAGDLGRVSHARARLRLGDRAAIATLRQYADANAAASDAPLALYTAADALGSDSLLREVGLRWPRDPLASRARMRLALESLRRRDSARAEPYLEGEVAADGSAALRARYLLARVRMARRDTAGASEALAALAAVDSLGYYGLLARQASGLPAPILAPPPSRAPDSTAVSLVGQLALLDSLGMEEEAEVLLASIVGRAWDDPEAMLDAADALVGIGRANQAIRLGFAASRRLGFHHPRVLRAIFPWPQRDLVSAESAAFGLDPFLVAGLIRQESWFLPTARSRAGAVGLMQLMPATARDVARRLGVSWRDAFLTLADANLHLGSAHLAGLARHYGRDIARALAAYNAGGRPVARWSRLRGTDDAVGFVEQIGYPETQQYVRAVLRNRDLYRALYGADAEEP